MPSITLGPSGGESEQQSKLPVLYHLPTILSFGVYLCVLNMHTFGLFDKHHFENHLKDPK